MSNFGKLQQKTQLVATAFRLSGGFLANPLRKIEKILAFFCRSV